MVSDDDKNTIVVKVSYDNEDTVECLVTGVDDEGNRISTTIEMPKSYLYNSKKNHCISNDVS